MSCDNWTVNRPGQQVDSEIAPTAIVHRATCPVCGELLGVPVGCDDCIVRCGRCRRRFRLPKRLEVVEEAVISWLNEPLTDMADPPMMGTPINNPQEIDAPVDIPQSDLKIVRTGSDGVLFEFPAALLKDAEFRASMPRLCLGCGTQQGLLAFVVVFMPHLRNKILLKAQRIAGRATLDDNDAVLLSDEELVKSLTHVPDVPPPADRPFPYWLCEPCQGSGAVSGRIDTTSGPGAGKCLMLIGNAQMAYEFFRIASEKETARHQLTASEVVQSAKSA